MGPVGRLWAGEGWEVGEQVQVRQVARWSPWAHTCRCEEVSFAVIELVEKVMKDCLQQTLLAKNFQI